MDTGFGNISIGVRAQPSPSCSWYLAATGITDISSPSLSLHGQGWKERTTVHPDNHQQSPGPPLPMTVITIREPLQASSKHAWVSDLSLSLGWYYMREKEMCMTSGRYVGKRLVMRSVESAGLGKDDLREKMECPCSLPLGSFLAATIIPSAIYRFWPSSTVPLRHHQLHTRLWASRRPIAIDGKTAAEPHFDFDHPSRLLLDVGMYSAPERRSMEAMGHRILSWGSRHQALPSERSLNPTSCPLYAHQTWTKHAGANLRSRDPLIQKGNMGMRTTTLLRQAYLSPTFLGSQLHSGRSSTCHSSGVVFLMLFLNALLAEKLPSLIIEASLVFTLSSINQGV
ncbi:hypothetical protein BKA70DRAFT_1401615 [Coprinopsis sp. MPI-PUGE-AT-0042]|nr:hypothetical protein BKA70DRAFT_1401615 [Coprinopsis sp. MPI-PUGE-AT-0042]